MSKSLSANQAAIHYTGASRPNTRRRTEVCFITCVAGSTRRILRCRRPRQERQVDFAMLIRIGFDVTFELPIPISMILMLYVDPARAEDLQEPEQIRCSPVLPIGTFM